MAPSRKTDSSSKTRSSSSSKVSLAKVKGENFYRDAKQVGRLKMLNGGKAVRDKNGKIIQAAAFQKGEDETKPGRIQPDRRWFGALNPPCNLWLETLTMASRQYESHLSNCFRSFQNKPFYKKR